MIWLLESVLTDSTYVFAAHWVSYWSHDNEGWFRQQELLWKTL